MFRMPVGGAARAAPNREPRGNRGLPRSGEQERTPSKALVFFKTGKLGSVGNPIREIGSACKSEDLPTVTLSESVPTAQASEGRWAMIGSAVPAHSFSLLLRLGRRGDYDSRRAIRICKC